MPATEQAPTLLSVLVRSLDRCKKAVDTSHYSGALEDTGNGLPLQLPAISQQFTAAFWEPSPHISAPVGPFVVSRFAHELAKTSVKA
jgi:hypothetical protein